MAEIKKHPIGFRILSLFFWVGAVASGLTFISLLFPGSFIEPIWQLNPRAREGFAAMGLWATFLMLAVCSACVAAAVGLWRNSRWGYWTAVIMITGNLIRDIANVLGGSEPRATIGIPIALAILAYLWSRRLVAVY